MTRGDSRLASDLHRSPLTGNFLADIASHTPDAAMRAHCPLPRRSSRDVLSALVAPGGVPLYSVALQGVASCGFGGGVVEGGGLWRLLFPARGDAGDGGGGA